MKEKKNGSSLGLTIFLVFILIAVGFGIFLKITKKDDKGTLEAEVQTTEASQILSRNMTSDYPATAREVLKFYCRITQCLYSGECTDAEIEKLVDLTRELYDDELLALNPRDEMLGLVRGDIAHYKSNGKTIYSYNIAESGDTKKINDYDSERNIIDLYFTVKDEDGFSRAYEKFVLRRDKTDKWRIMGWSADEDQTLGGK